MGKDTSIDLANLSGHIRRHVEDLIGLASKAEAIIAVLAEQREQNRALRRRVDDLEREKSRLVRRVAILEQDLSMTKGSLAFVMSIICGGGIRPTS